MVSSKTDTPCFDWTEYIMFHQDVLWAIHPGRAGIYTLSIQKTVDTLMDRIDKMVRKNMSARTATANMPPLPCTPHLMGHIITMSKQQLTELTCLIVDNIWYPLMVHMINMNKQQLTKSDIPYQWLTWSTWTNNNWQSLISLINGSHDPHEQITIDKVWYPLSKVHMINMNKQQLTKSDIPYQWFTWLTWL